MQSLLILKPERPIAVVAQTAGSERLLTPDPKEAVQVEASGRSMTLDFGSPVTFDTAYAGYHTASGAQGWAVAAVDGASGSNPRYLQPDGGQPVAPLKPLGLGYPYHALIRGVPMTSRYWQFQFNANGGSYLVGTIAIGTAWQAQWGTEWGAGRPIEDTGTAERLFGGGFAIDDGVAAGGYSWTFGDLQPDEVRMLYQIVKDRRTTRSVLVVEDPEQTDGLNERIHWGLFGKLDTYERLDPMNTKWSLSVRDWA